MSKTNVLVFVDWYLPGSKAGGPIRSVANIIEKLSDRISFDVVTSIYDFGCSTPYPVAPNEWVRQGQANVLYLETPPSKEKILSLISAKSYTAIYFNSLFSKPYTLYPIKVLKSSSFNGKLILAPRGMLGKGALSIKPFKKKVFLTLARQLGWFKGIIWHASTVQEAKEIRQYFGENTTVHVAENIASLPVVNSQEKPLKKAGELKCIFVSRISSKKNLHFFLELITGLKDSPKLDFEILGPIEDQVYWDTCLKLIDQLPDHITVKVTGAIEHEDVLSHLTSNHLFILPTLHENYGHVVIEALAMGCPVLLSQNTPWRALRSKSLGADIPLTDRSMWLKEMNRYVEMGQTEYLHEVESALNFAKIKLVDASLVELNYQLFHLK